LHEDTGLAVERAPILPSVEPCVHILGSRVHLLSVNRTVDYMEHWMRRPDGVCRRIVVTGFHGIWKAHQNAQLQALLNSADLWVPDGIAPIWIAHLRGHRNIQRTPGADIIREFFSRADCKQYRSYFYGDTDSTLSALQAVVAREYPSHVVAGAFSPPFRPLTPDEDRDIIAQINAAQPDVLWVGLGMPKQDIWIYERLDQLSVPVAIGVGAAFAFIAGTVPRCPSWIGRMGFEWVYRFMKEPQKLWRRDLLEGPQFLFHAGLELLRKESQD
jgi:N-acetylglucosaminyldiphosphoundecaprenol N-acetyl-beta-D-mannosaminyltransferase